MRAVPVALPGQGDGDTSATLAHQLAAVLATVDAAAGKPCVVGHSAACSVAWLAADARPDKVDRVVLIGGFPAADGERYADFFPAQDGAMAFPCRTTCGRLRLRLLGERVLQGVAWTIADQLGWPDTYPAEYVALTQLQADAFVTLDPELALAVRGLVTVAPYDALV